MALQHDALSSLLLTKLTGRRYTIVSIALGVIALDQLSKASYSSYTLNIQGYLSSPITNLSAAILASLLLLILISLALHAATHPLKQIILVGLALEIGGGLSNLIDRAMFGGVRDIIFLPATASNLADVAIVCGAVMILVGIVTPPHHRDLTPTKATKQLGTPTK